MQRAPITISEVAKEIRLHVPLRKEFLIAAETGLAGRKELFVDLGLVEAGHGPAVEPERAAIIRYAPCRVDPASAYRPVEAAWRSTTWDESFRSVTIRNRRDGSFGLDAAPPTSVFNGPIA